MKFRVGDRVLDRADNTGIIKAIDGAWAKIKFDYWGEGLISVFTLTLRKISG